MATIGVSPDGEKARSLMKLAELRLSAIQKFDEDEESALIAEGLYEAAKELSLALLSIDGKKALSHKEAIEYLGETYSEEFTLGEIALFDRFRKERNALVYRGAEVPPSYVKRNRPKMTALIEKLLSLCSRRLESRQ